MSRPVSFWQLPFRRRAVEASAAAPISEKAATILAMAFDISNRLSGSIGGLEMNRFDGWQHSYSMDSRSWIDIAVPDKVQLASAYAGHCLMRVEDVVPFAGELWATKARALAVRIAGTQAVNGTLKPDNSTESFYHIELGEDDTPRLDRGYYRRAGQMVLLRELTPSQAAAELTPVIDLLQIAAEDTDLPYHVIAA